MAGIHTGKQLTVVEAQDASYVPFNPGQLIIQDDGATYYDRTSGTSVEQGRASVSSGTSSDNAPFNMKGVIHSTSTMPTAPAEGDTYIFTDTQSLNGESTLGWLNKHWTAFPANMDDFDKCTITDAPDSSTSRKALRIENYKGDPQGLIALAAAEKLIITLADTTQVSVCAIAKPAEREENGVPVTYLIIIGIESGGTITDGTITSPIIIDKEYTESAAGVFLKTVIYNGDMVRYSGKYWQVIGRGGEIKFNATKYIRVGPSLGDGTDYATRMLPQINPYCCGASELTFDTNGEPMSIDTFLVPDNLTKITIASDTTMLSIDAIYGHKDLTIYCNNFNTDIGSIVTAKEVYDISASSAAGQGKVLELHDVAMAENIAYPVQASYCGSLFNCNIYDARQIDHVSGCYIKRYPSDTINAWMYAPATSLNVTGAINYGDDNETNGVNGVNNYGSSTPSVEGTPPNLTYIGINSTSNFKVKQTASKWESTTTYTDYPYRTYISVTFMTEEHFPYVIFDSTALASGVFDGAPVETAQNKLYIYAKSIPTFDFQIDFKAVV